MNEWHTADISDKYHEHIQYVNRHYYHYGKQLTFSGQIATIKCFEDNSLVREMLSRDGKGKVLVVDAGASLRCAMLGDQLAKLAIDNGWSGIVIDGLIRDSDAINKMPLAVRALGVFPLKSVKKGIGEVGVDVTFAGVTFSPGHYLYADADGIIVLQEKITDDNG